MLKVICDICGQKTASERFKVKKETETTFTERRWIPIDICKDCYQKLIFASGKEDKK